MTNEQIEQAAYLYSETLLLSNGNERAEAMGGFIKGASWRINSVWHDAKEEPKQNEWFIAQIGDDSFDTFIMAIKSERWEIWCSGMNLMRWAYVADLLPEGNGK